MIHFLAIHGIGLIDHVACRESASDITFRGCHTNAEVGVWTCAPLLILIQAEFASNIFSDQIFLYLGGLSGSCRIKTQLHERGTLESETFWKGFQVTGIDCAWLPHVAPKECKLSKPLDTPAPWSGRGLCRHFLICNRFDDKKDQLLCLRKGTFGPFSVPLPVQVSIWMEEHAHLFAEVRISRE